MHTDFNKVDHKIFMSVLESSCFAMLLVAWFKLYLNNEYQWVTMYYIKYNMVFLGPSGILKGGH